jgi:hypothetical protein
VVVGLLGIAAGIVAFVWPGITTVMLIGARPGARHFEIIGAIQLRKEIDNEWWLILCGALSLVWPDRPTPRAPSRSADLGNRRLFDRLRRHVRRTGAALRKKPRRTRGNVTCGRSPLCRRDRRLLRRRLLPGGGRRRPRLHAVPVTAWRAAHEANAALPACSASGEAGHARERNFTV